MRKTDTSGAIPLPLGLKSRAPSRLVGVDFVTTPWLNLALAHPVRRELEAQKVGDPISSLAESCAANFQRCLLHWYSYCMF